MAGTPRTFVVCGPSGVGKSTLLKRLMAAREGLDFSVSWTTRPPREDETDGVHYHFRPQAAFDDGVRRGWFAEYAHVHLKSYGTPWSELSRIHGAGCDAVLDIDVQGVRQLQALALPAVYVFIAPPSLEALVERLERRGEMTPEQMAVRAEAARVEVAQAYLFDYVVINDDFETAAAELTGIVTAERCRRRHA